MSTTCDHYDRYGGRGITVCQRWSDSFEDFLEDMGPRPEGTSLDRIDNDRGYEPENCRWAAASRQQRNQRQTKLLEWHGVRLPLADWADMMGLSRTVLWSRVKRGWSDERVLSTPVDLSKSRSRGGSGVLVAAATLLVALLISCSAHAIAQDEDPEIGLVEGHLVGEPSPTPAPVLRPQLIHRDHVTPIVLGTSAAVIGGVSLIAGWSIYFARQAYREKPWPSLSDGVISTWQTQGAFAWWLTFGGSTLLITSEYLLLPESREVPTLAWVLGGVGVGVAAVGLGFAVGGTHCPPQRFAPGADLRLACDSVTSDAEFGPMLAMSALPLINWPIALLLRKAFAGAPESLSFGPGSVSLTGRF